VSSVEGKTYTASYTTARGNSLDKGSGLVLKYSVTAVWQDIAKMVQLKTQCSRPLASCVGLSENR